MQRPDIENKYKRRGGWLDFFFAYNILSFVALFLPIQYMIQYMITGSPSRMVLWDSVIMGVVICSLSIIAAILLKKRNKKCIVLFNICRLFAIARGFFCFFLWPYNVGTFILGMLVQVFQIVAWTLYFQRSERVRVYFNIQQ